MELERSRLVRLLPHGHQDDRVTIGDTRDANWAAGVLRDALESDDQVIIPHMCRLAVAELEFPGEFHRGPRRAGRTPLRNLKRSWRAGACTCEKQARRQPMTDRP